MLTLFAPLVLLGTLQGDLLPAPQLTRIVVQPDTVWFAGPLQPWGSVDTIAYALVRGTGQWLRIGRRSFPPSAKLLPKEEGDMVALLPGFGLAVRKVQVAPDSVVPKLGITSTAD